MSHQPSSARLPRANRLVNLRGPDNVLRAVERLADPEVDGVIVHQIVDPDTVTNFYPPILGIPSLRHSPAGDVAAHEPAEYFGRLKQAVPQLDRVDELVKELWTDLAFANTALESTLYGHFFARHDLASPHIDVISSYDDVSYWGPIGVSVGLQGESRFRFERLPKALFSADDPDHINLEHCDSMVKFTGDELRRYYAGSQPRQPRSHGVQREGDLAMWVEPTVAHEVVSESAQRLALICSQTQQQTQAD